MKPIVLKLPHRAAVTGEILRDYTDCPRRLNQDILQVGLDCGIVIDVGWSPTGNPDGFFIISVFEREWDKQLIAPIKLKSPSETARLVEQMASEYSSGRKTAGAVPGARQAMPG